MCGIRRLFNKLRSKCGRSQNKNDGEWNARGPTGLRLLHRSPNSLVDLIFVHGLAGGSVKTWRRGKDPQCFWPELWLPVDPGFENVNIHTFGYDSDWANLTPSILNIHDFGEALLEEMRNSPDLRDDRKRPIILIGHSMGGLVIKKAFILAQNVPNFKTRIRSIFFLATPHQGSNYAAMLNNILSASGIISSRSYVSDLTAGSVTIQRINNDFGKVGYDLPIFSFYETQKTSLGGLSVLIVDQESAVLGHNYRKERIQYINANHRDICKFRNANDPNYATVKNTLISAIEDLLEEISNSAREESREHIKTLMSYLDVSDCPAEHHPKANGSCQWIDTRDDFEAWRDGSDDLFAHGDTELKRKNGLSIFWVHAKPGAGKTVLASHVISQFQIRQYECAFYHFHDGDETSLSLSHFLRSIAFQMAKSNSVIRSKLLQLCQGGSALNMEDSWVIWVKVFREARVYTPQYLVIDAIDECNKYQEFFTMLSDDKPNFPFRVFITSRNVHHIQRLRRCLESSAVVTSIEIPIQDTMHDIQCYIQNRIEILPVDHPAEKEALTNRILRRSDASFLWVRLVIDEIEGLYSSESIMTALERIPEGMAPYYGRIVKTMAANTLEKHIAKTVLAWAVVCTRRLKTHELSQAVELDIKAGLPSAKSAVEGLCCHLVTVDEDSGSVDLVHLTAREFLISEDAGEFVVSRPDAHKRAALTCLQLLSGRELRPPRNSRFLDHDRPEPSPLLNYAITEFSDHICSASLETDELLAPIDKFLRTNVLGWIERLALQGYLHIIIRVSKNLKAFLNRRAKCRPTESDQVENIGRWSTDLGRLVPRLGEALLQDPSSIYFLLPPLCPPESAVYQQLGGKEDGLSLVGRRNPTWDDCVAYIDFPEAVAMSVSCGDGLVAVGMLSGEVHIYNHHICQKEVVIRPERSVDLIHLADGFIAVSTINSLVLYNQNGVVIWESRLRFRCILLTSSDDRIIAISTQGEILQWDKDSGTLLEDQRLEYQRSETMEEGYFFGNLLPYEASISPDLETLALGYGSGTVCLWDICQKEFIGWAEDEQGRTAKKLLFNPNSGKNIFLAIYADHGLSLYETWCGSLLHTRAICDAGFSSASCSPDGQTVATMDTRGNMRIWDFESLCVLYQIRSPFTYSPILDFTSDGTSLVDVVPSCLRIWSPAVLVHRNVKDTGSNDNAVELPVSKEEYRPHGSDSLTAICVLPSAPVVLAGRCNGQVVAFNAETGTTTALYSHSRSEFIKHLATNADHSTMASADIMSAVHVRRLSLSGGARADSAPLWEIQAAERIEQLCFSANGNYLLVATVTSDSVYHVKDGSCIGQRTFEPQERKTRRWLLLPETGWPEKEEQKEGFWLLSDGVMRHFSTELFPSPNSNDDDTNDSGIRLQYTLDEGCIEEGIETVSVNPSTWTLVLEVRHSSKAILSSSTFLFDLSKPKLSSSPSTSTTETITLTPLSAAPLKRCKYFLGFSERNSSFVFLHEDSWVSSVGLPDLEDKRYMRHFYVPNDFLYLSARDNGVGIMPVKTAGDHVVFCLHGELVAVRNGMGFSRKGALE